MKLVGSEKRARPLVDAAPDEALAERVRAGIERQARLNLIMGHGCADCCGYIGLNGDGSELLCARVTRDMFDGVDRAAVLACGVPALYARVMRGETTEVTADAVRAARAAEAGGEE